MKTPMITTITINVYNVYKQKFSVMINTQTLTQPYYYSTACTGN